MIIESMTQEMIRMDIDRLVLCSEEEFESLANDENIVIEVGMIVGGERFRDAIVIDDYRTKDVKDVMNEIDKKGSTLISRYSAVIAGRELHA